MRLWFFAAAVAASVITVQDSVLTGLRAAVWVPVGNAAFGVAKIVLLVVLAVSMPRSGVFFSWIIPMIIVMFPVNLLIFGRLLPRHMRTTTHAVDLTRAQIGRFFAADYLGALFLFATIYLVPVLVATRVEPHTYAYFFVAWTIASVMNLVAVNMATSLAVEGVYDAPRLAGNCRSALTRALGLLLVGAVVISLAAPYTLGLLGTGYLDAAPLLQLLVIRQLAQCDRGHLHRHATGAEQVQVDHLGAGPAGSARVGTGHRLDPLRPVVPGHRVARGSPQWEWPCCSASSS